MSLETAPRRSGGDKPKKPLFSVQDRLEFGNLTIDEVCALKQRCRASFYEDVKAGLVEIRKTGRRSYVFGPDARRYIQGIAA